MDRLSVESPSAKEETGDAYEVHQPSNQEASRHAKRQGDYQEEQSRRIELEVGDELLAEDGKDGREDIEYQAVAAQEEEQPPPRSPFGGVLGKRRGLQLGHSPKGGAGGGCI